METGWISGNRRGERGGIIKKVRLGEGAPVIGSPFPWPHAKMPNELFPSMSGMVFLKSNGATFTASLYQKLALVYPDLKLPDLRGEFIRGWDDGRGVDSGRQILSAQGDQFKSHNHLFNFFTGYASGGGTGAVYEFNGSAGRSTQDTGGNETRPRNIAFNYIVRAA